MIPPLQKNVNNPENFEKSFELKKELSEQEFKRLWSEVDVNNVMRMKIFDGLDQVQES